MLNTSDAGQVGELERRHRRLGAEVDLGVRLVGGEHEAVLARERRGPLVERERRGRAGRVVRVVEPQDRRPRCQVARGDRVEVGQEAGVLAQRQLEHLLAGEQRAALVDRVGGRGHRDAASPPSTCARWKIASLEPSVGSTCVSGSSAAPKRRASPAGDRLAQLGQPVAPTGRWRAARAPPTSAARMNAGVSSRGSPMPKSIRSTPSARSRRLGLVEAHERVRLQAGEGGGELHAANRSRTS